jgi:3-oxoacyl-[acyl-carrier-protein] synthase-3
MEMTLRARITGAGMFVPERVVTNKDLEEVMDTSDEWIRQRSGVEERHWLVEGETPSDLAERASRRALADAGLEADDLDCIILATLSPEHEFPGTSFFLQERLGGETPCFDLRAQCSGFQFSLSVARSYVLSGQFERILVVGCEAHSRGLDISTEGRDVSVLFGDGAGAVIVEGDPDPGNASGILEVRLHSQGKFARKLWVESDSCAQHPFRLTQENLDSKRIYPKMDGRFVFKHAVTRMPQVLLETLNAASIKQEEVDLFFFHQANLRINEFVANSLKIPPEKVPSNIQRYGNCSAASIPMLIAEAKQQGALAPGTIASMTGFGSGFTWVSAVVRW